MYIHTHTYATRTNTVGHVRSIAARPIARALLAAVAAMPRHPRAAEAAKCLYMSTRGHACVYMYVCDACVYKYERSACMSVYICACVYVSVYTCLFVCMFLCILVCLYVCTQCTSTPATHKRPNVSVRIYARMHAFTYTYACTQTDRQ